MKEILEMNSASFCLNMMERLDAQGVNAENITDILKTLCTFFGFSYGFMYYQNEYHGTFPGAVVSVTKQRSPLPDQLNPQGDWEARIHDELRINKVIYATTGTEPGIAMDFQELLGIETYLMLPVVDEESKVTAVIGMANEPEDEPVDRAKYSIIYTVLVIIANHIKVWLYFKRIDRIEEALAAIVDNMGVDIYVNDFDTHEVLYVNRSMAVPYGGPEAMVGRKCWKVLYDDKTEQCEYCPQKKLTDQDGKPTKVYSWNYERPFDHSWFRVLSAAFQWGDGRLAHIVSSIDITENIKNEQLIRILAEYDTLTGISNRRKLFDDCEAMLARCRAQGKIMYLLFFDLNKFKQVNDVYGHRAGDELLGQIGTYLSQEAPFGEHVYRFGGDEFVILFEDQTRAQVLAQARQLQEHFFQPWVLSCCEAVCHASIGIAAYDPVSDPDVETLIQYADTAMYQSKQKGGGDIIFYHSDVQV